MSEENENEVGKRSASGFGGCFGCGAAIVVVLIVAGVIGAVVGGGSTGNGAAENSFCAMAVSKAARLARLPSSISVLPGTDRAMGSVKDRHLCAAGGSPLYQVTYDVRCANAFEPGCVRLVSVLREDGKILYLNKQAADELK